MVYDLEERLLSYSASIVRLTERLVKTRAGRHVANQLLRCGTSPLFNHGEAQAAESADDFVHKMSVCLKELRESKRELLLIKRVPLVDNSALVEPLLAETDELIRIFVATYGRRRRRPCASPKHLTMRFPRPGRRVDRRAVRRSELGVGRSSVNVE